MACHRLITTSQEVNMRQLRRFSIAGFRRVFRVVSLSLAAFRLMQRQIRLRRTADVTRGTLVLTRGFAVHFVVNFLQVFF